jgi:hypothetical protein
MLTSYIEAINLASQVVPWHQPLISHAGQLGMGGLLLLSPWIGFPYTDARDVCTPGTPAERAHLASTTKSRHSQRRAWRHGCWPQPCTRRRSIRSRRAQAINGGGAGAWRRLDLGVLNSGCWACRTDRVVLWVILELPQSGDLMIVVCVRRTRSSPPFKFGDFWSRHVTDPVFVCLFGDLSAFVNC